MKVGDVFQHRKYSWLRLHEKGGKRHEVPCHPLLAEYLNAWFAAAGIGRDKKGPLFRSLGKGADMTNPVSQHHFQADLRHVTGGDARTVSSERS